MDQNQLPPQGGQTSVLSLVSMILGIISLPLICCSIFDLPLALGAIICGHLGLKDVANNSGKTGGGMGKAGLIMGYIALVLSIGFFITSLVMNGGKMQMDMQEILEQMKNAQQGIEQTTETAPELEPVPAPDAAPAPAPVQ